MNMNPTVLIILAMIFPFCMALKLTTRVDATDESDYNTRDGDKFQEYDADTEENNQPIKLEQEVLSDNKLKAQYLEIRELIKQEIIKNDEKKKSCYMKDNGLFWDGNKGACESCDKHCIEENLTHCAFQCKAYLQAKKESKDTELSYSRLENGIESTNITSILIITAVLVLFTVLLVLGVYFYMKQQAQVERLEHKLQQALPEGDKQGKMAKHINRENGIPTSVKIQ